MVFMGAATIDGNADLSQAAVDDLIEMAQVGSGDALNIYVQVHRGGGSIPRRVRVVEGMRPQLDALPVVPVDERNPAGGEALRYFIRSSLYDAQHDPKNEQHYSLLVLWGHAYDFAFGREPTSQGIIDALDYAELARVLERLQLEFGAPDAKLDIVGFDACDIATVEMACQLERFADYLVGSQIGIPLPGWPYDRILDRLRRPKRDLMGPAEFGTYLVRRYCEAYRLTAPVSVTLTMLNLSCARDLVARAEVLALVLASTIDDPDALAFLADLFRESQTEPRKPFVDVGDLCYNLIRRVDDPVIVRVARQLGDFLICPRGNTVGKANDPYVRPFVIEHGRNTAETARLNGVSMYAPHLAPERDFEAVRHLYNNFVFAQDTHWSALVHALTTA
jgi:Clostripain family